LTNADGKVRIKSIEDKGSVLWMHGESCWIGLKRAARHKKELKMLWNSVFLGLILREK
jgi:hypothetical protein